MQSVEQVLRDQINVDCHQDNKLIEEYIHGYSSTIVSSVELSEPSQVWFVNVNFSYSMTDNEQNKKKETNKIREI